MTMDWIPSVDLLEMTGVSGSETARTLLNEEQERHLQQAFDMFDENQSQTITIGQFSLLSLFAEKLVPSNVP